MLYYLVETLNRKTGEVTKSNPIDVDDDTLKKWMQPYKDYLVDKLAQFINEQQGDKLMGRR